MNSIKSIKSISLNNTVLTVIDAEDVGMEFDMVRTALGHLTFSTTLDHDLFVMTGTGEGYDVPGHSIEDLKGMLTRFNVTL